MASWTSPRTWSTSELVTSAMMNTHVRDNLNAISPAPATTLPGSPANGDWAILVDSTTVATYQWMFRYNGGSSNADKWEFMGGPPVLVTVDTDESTASTGSWLNLTTSGPNFTAPVAGVYDVTACAGTWNSSATAINYIGLTTADGTPGAANITAVTVATAATFLRDSLGTVSKRYTGVAASDVLRLRYQTNGGTAHWLNRWMRILPVRVS